MQYCSLYICDVFISHKAQKSKGQENNKKKHKLQKLYRNFVLQELKPRPWAADYKPPAPADENSNVKKTPEEIEREIKVGFHIRYLFLKGLFRYLGQTKVIPITFYVIVSRFKDTEKAEPITVFSNKFGFMSSLH